MFRTAAILLFVAAVTGCSGPATTPKVGASPDRKPAEKKSAILASYPGKDTPFQISLELDPPRPLFADKTKTRVRVTDRSGKPVEDAKVHAALVMPLMDMGKNEYELKHAGGGVYEGTANFSMAGEWEIILEAAAPGRSGKHTFNVMVEE